jgi:hypothetical protein
MTMGSNALLLGTDMTLSLHLQLSKIVVSLYPLSGRDLLWRAFGGFYGGSEQGMLQ